MSSKVSTPLELIFAFLFLSNIRLSFSFSFNGFEVHDLEKNNYTEFLLEADAWTATAVRDNTKVSNCNNVPLLGGNSILGLPGSSIGTQNQYFQRIYTNLPPHNVIYYAMSFWLIDSWDLNDYYTINFDNTSTKGVVDEKGKFPSALCGLTGYNDLNDVRVFGKISHSNPTLTLRIVSQLDQPTYDESFGLRNVKLIFANTATAPPASVNQICGNAPIKLTTDECLCPIGRYPSLILPFIIICSKCDLSCGACFGSSATECYECNEGYSFNGTQCVPCSSNCSVCNGTNPNQCLVCKPNSYLFLNSTCVSQCESPFIQRNNGNTLMCDRPCSSGPYYYPDSTCLSSCNFPLQLNVTTSECSSPCANQEYLYWDGSCFSNCSLPLSQTVEGGIQLCIFNCNANDFLHINGSCLGNCSFPLVTKIQNGRKFCNYPCQSSEFLYSNGSCLPYCNFPFVQETIENVRYCSFPCSTSKFLYYNQSCLATCDPPFVQTGTLEYRSCDHPCSNASFYMFSGGKCSDTCFSPLNQRIEGTSKFCDYPCQTNQYLYSNGICSDFCSSPLIIRTENEGNYCDYPCTDSQYLYWNSSCLLSCDSPLQQTTRNGFQFCEFPCHFSGFLYWDGTCSSNCPFPLNQRIEGVLQLNKFCEFGCSLNDFLYWDGTCSPSCDFPLIPNTFKQRKFCQHPCQDPNHFIFPNNSCQSSCPAPFRSHVAGSLNYCDYPCPGEQFLYWNGSCSDSCKGPLVQRFDTGFRVCEYPCEESRYLFWNGICIDSCESPLRLFNLGLKKFCFLPCDSPFDYYYPDIRQCKSTCTYPYLINEEQLFLSCTLYNSQISQNNLSSVNQEENSTPSNIETKTTNVIQASAVISLAFSENSSPDFIILIMFFKLIKYIYYLDIEFPIRLTNMIKNTANQTYIFNFGPRLGFDIKRYSLPDVFERYGMHSSFLVNFGEIFTSLLIIFGTLGFLLLFGKIIEKYKKSWLSNIIRKFKVLLKWNMMIMILLSNVDGVILYSALDFMTLNFSSPLDAVSFFGCLGMIFVSFTIIFTSFYLLRNLHKLKTQSLLIPNNKKYSSFIQKLNSYQILWQGVKENAPLTQAYLSLFFTRIVTVYLIASYLYTSPVTQTILYVFLSLTMLGYLIKAKPFEKKINFVQVLVYEIIVVLVNLSLLSLAILQESQTEAHEVRIFLGDLIVLFHVAIYLIAIMFLVLKLAFKIKKFCIKYNRQLKPQKRILWQLLIIFLQQLGTGYQEIKLFEPLSSDVNLVTTQTQIVPINRFHDKEGQDKSNRFNSKIVISDEDGGTSTKFEISSVPISFKSDEDQTFSMKNFLDAKFELSSEQSTRKLKTNYNFLHYFEDELYQRNELSLASFGGSSVRTLSKNKSLLTEISTSSRKDSDNSNFHLDKTHSIFVQTKPRSLKPSLPLEKDFLSSPCGERSFLKRQSQGSESSIGKKDSKLQIIFDKPEEESNLSEFSFAKKPKAELDLNIGTEILGSPKTARPDSQEKQQLEKIKSKCLGQKPPNLLFKRSYSATITHEDKGILEDKARILMKIEARNNQSVSRSVKADSKMLEKQSSRLHLRPIKPRNLTNIVKSDYKNKPKIQFARSKSMGEQETPNSELNL